MCFFPGRFPAPKRVLVNEVLTPDFAKRVAVADMRVEERALRVRREQRVVDLARNVPIDIGSRPRPEGGAQFAGAIVVMDRDQGV